MMSCLGKSAGLFLLVLLGALSESECQRSRAPFDPFVLFEKCGQIQEIPGDLRTRVPWSIGIFVRTKATAPWKYFVMGALIGPSTVISIFGGPYGALPRGASGKYHYFEPSNIMAVGGISSSDLSEVDQNAQFAEVEYLQPYNDRNPNNHDYHFFMLNLKTSFNVTSPYVRPICMVIYRPNTTPYVRWEGFASSFSTPISPSIVASQQSDLKRKLTVYTGMAQKREECESAFRFYFGGKNASHIYCARIDGVVGDGDLKTCPAHGGAGAVYVIRWWFLNGLGASAPLRRRGVSNCDEKTLFFIAHFINQPALDWARSQLDCGPKTFTCNDGNGTCLALTRVCDGVRDCSDGTDEDGVFCKASNHCPKSKPFLCHLNGKCISASKLCDGVEDCPRGHDEKHQKCLERDPAYSVSATLGLSKCSPLPAQEGINSTCIQGLTNDVIDCSETRSGDSARLTCSQYFQSKLRWPAVSIKCDEIGGWNPTISFGCTHECGRIDEEKRDQLFPWHAAIFHLDENRRFTLVCGGTLIENSLIVTSANCLTEPTGLSASLKRYRIVLAPVSDVFEENERSRDSQILQITRIWIAPKFSFRNTTADVAMARLSSAATYNDKVRAACYLQPHLSRVPDEGFSGEIPRFLKLESVKRWNIVDSEVVSSNVCTASGLLLTQNSYCVSQSQVNSPGTKCSTINSGSGIFFPILGNDNRYVFKGVVSYGEVYARNQVRERECQKYATIVHVDSFKQWMFGILENSYRTDI